MLGGSLHSGHSFDVLGNQLIAIEVATSRRSGTIGGCMIFSKTCNKDFVSEYSRMESMDGFHTCDQNSLEFKRPDKLPLVVDLSKPTSV